MTVQSRAAVLRQPTDSSDFTENQPISIETIEVDEPRGDEVRVEIKAASLCHTDVSMILGNMYEPYPLVMGHEGAGVVVDVGPDVRDLEPGDHVALGRIACGKCEYCRSGRSNLCEGRTRARQEGTLKNGEIRFHKNGEKLHHCHGVSSFSRYTVVTEEVANKIPDSLPFREATLLGCAVFSGVGAVTSTADIDEGDAVAIFGLGGVGLCALQGALLRDADPVVAIDVMPEKLRLAEKMGATHTVNPSGVDDLGERVREITGGGCNYSFETTGVPDVLEQALDVLRTDGAAVMVGLPAKGKKDVKVDIFDLVVFEKKILGSLNGSYNLPLAVPRLARLVDRNKLQLTDLITAEKSLEDLNAAAESLEKGSDHIRQVIYPE